MGLPMFPRPTNPMGVFEAIDRDDTEEENKVVIRCVEKIEKIENPRATQTQVIHSSYKDSAVD